MIKWIICVFVMTAITAVIFFHQEMRIKEMVNYQVSLLDEYNVLFEQNGTLQGSIDRLQEKYKASALDEPTYLQVKESLLEMKGVKIEGNCLDKVKYVQDYFYDKGLQCYVVVTNYKGGFGHATVAFNTEKGWIHVEPETMAEIRIAVDMPYYLPNRAYEGPVGMTAQQFAENHTVIQMMILR